MPRAILFDLDGTLVDTRAASWALFSETNLKFALGIASRDAFFSAFEGNFFDSLATLVPDPERAAAAKAHFMELLRTRYHPAVIPGMVDVIRGLAPQCTLAVVSSNGIEAIRRILVGAGIATCFSHVFSGDVEPRKAASMRRFLGDHRYATHRLCAPDYQDGGDDAARLGAQEVVLVTDTVGDVGEAREVGVRAIGVAWGMHTETQLLEAGAERVALWPQELLAWLGDTTQPVAACACNASPGTSATSAACLPCSAPPILTQETGKVQGDPVIEAGRVRSALRLQTRLQRRASLDDAAAPPTARRLSNGGSAHAELMRAVQRIVSGACR